MKRVLSNIVLLSLLFSLIGTVFAQETSDGFQYRVEKDGTATISGYEGKGGSLVIPSEIEGIKVHAIGNGAFVDKQSINSVMIPEGVITIGDGAFNGCRSLRSVTLPSTLTSIGESAFEACYDLRSIVIPENVTEIKDKTFLNCMELSEVILSKNLTSIGYVGFCGCAFGGIELPYGLTNIGREAFNGVRNLNELVIPNSVKKIGWLAFDQLKDIKSIILPSGLAKMDDLLHDCPKLEKIAIPKSVTSIKGGLNFDGCHKVSIWGFKGSAAETFAKKNDIPFVTVDPVNEVRILSNGKDVTEDTLFIDLNTDIVSLQLAFQTSPESLWPGVVWVSSKPKIATVDASGLVTGLANGKAKITATAVDGSKKKATCEITVTNLVKEIQITGENTVKAGKKIKLVATALPEATSNKKIEWTTSDKTIATVDAKGSVTAKKVSEEKTVTITATAKDGSGVFTDIVITVVP